MSEWTYKNKVVDELPKNVEGFVYVITNLVDNRKYIGKKLAKFTMATNESYKNAKGEKVTDTQWHNIIAWNKLADFVTEYLQKGQLIYIEGKLQTRTYKDKDDVQHWKTEVITNVITPLEWKTGEKKENVSVKQNAENLKEETVEEELPF